MKPWTRLLIGLLTGVAVFASVATIRRSAQETTLPSYWQAPDFALVDQTGAPVATADLAGTVWVASFVFTHCADVCPGIGTRMARLGEALRREGMLGQSVRLVSFTVDPERDTPPVLLQYARGFGGLPPAEWAFLTGADGAAMRAMIQEGFHLTALMPEASVAVHDEHGQSQTPAAGHDDHGPSQATATATATGADYQVAHTPRVLLVDRTGTVRGIYDALDDEAMGRILADARRLTES